MSSNHFETFEKLNIYNTCLTIFFLNDDLEIHLKMKPHRYLRSNHGTFQVLEESNRYVYGHVTEEQWHSIVPELAEYQAKKHECSVYAQLLPKPLYQQLLVFRHF